MLFYVTKKIKFTQAKKTARINTRIKSMQGNEIGRPKVIYE